LVKKGMLLLMLASIFMSIAMPRPAKADGMTIAVDPASITVNNVGDVFTVNVTIANAANVYGVQFKLQWNGAIVNCTSVTLPSGHFMDPDGVEQANDNLWIISKKRGDSTAEYAVTYYSLDDADARGTTPRIGNGILATLTMKALAVGSTQITFDLDGTVIGDRNGQPLDFTKVDGEITVVPEFNSIGLILMLIAATTVTLLAIKKQTKKL